MLWLHALVSTNTPLSTLNIYLFHKVTNKNTYSNTLRLQFLFVNNKGLKYNVTFNIKDKFRKLVRTIWLHKSAENKCKIYAACITQNFCSTLSVGQTYHHRMSDQKRMHSSFVLICFNLCNHFNHTETKASTKPLLWIEILFCYLEFFIIFSKLKSKQSIIQDSFLVTERCFKRYFQINFLIFIRSFFTSSRC